jgi:hypothetical protein
VKPVVVQTAAPSFEVELQPIDARDVGEFERVLADFAGAPNGGDGITCV